MNDDIISLLNGDFRVERRNDLKKILSDRFESLIPLTEYDIQNLHTTVTELGNPIAVGDKIGWVFIRSERENPKPDELKIIMKLCILSDKEIEFYNNNFDLYESSSMNKIMTVNRKI